MWTNFILNKFTSTLIVSTFHSSCTHFNSKSPSSTWSSPPTSSNWTSTTKCPKKAKSNSSMPKSVPSKTSAKPYGKSPKPIAKSFPISWTPPANCKPRLTPACKPANKSVLNCSKTNLSPCPYQPIKTSIKRRTPMINLHSKATAIKRRKPNPGNSWSRWKEFWTLWLWRNTVNNKKTLPFTMYQQSEAWPHRWNLKAKRPVTSLSMASWFLERKTNNNTANPSDEPTQFHFPRQKSVKCSGVHHYSKIFNRTKIRNPQNLNPTTCSPVTFTLSSSQPSLQ